MKLITEYHEKIPSDYCNLTDDLPVTAVLEARLVAHILPSDGFARTILKFSIEENIEFTMKLKLDKKYTHKSGPWMTLGYNTWTSASELPHNITHREFCTFLNCLSVGNSNAGNTIMDFFNELEVVPAYETGKDSWIKTAVPRWYDFLMKNEKIMRDHDLRKVMES